MTPEHILREKLRKIEALFAGAATAGEKAAAGALRKVSASVLAKPQAGKGPWSRSSRFPMSGRGSYSLRYAGVTVCAHSFIGGCTVK
jgi:hypothetical protein